MWILEFTVAGQGWVRTPGGRADIHTGDMLLFHPETPQDYGMDDGVGTWDHVWVCFAPRAAWREWLVWPELAPGIVRLHIPPAERARLQDRLAAVAGYLHGPFKRRDEFAVNALEEVLLWCDTVNPNSHQARQDPRIHRVMEVICARYARPLALAELAAVAGLSTWRFAHLCKEQTGQTPQQLLTAYRLARAAELLIMTGKPIAEIAEDTGFANPFYFSRVFRRAHAMSPRDYRKQHTG
jgi:AraC family transcriptional regulator of arabinose operon